MKIDYKFKIKNSKLSMFINDFPYPSPSWENLPVDFPYCDATGLTIQEKHLFNAIKTMWVFENKNKKEVFEKFVANYEPVIVSTGTKLVNAIVVTTTSFVLVMTIISLTYYINVKYNLGIKFLTDFFA